MIQREAQSQAEARRLAPGTVQCISPYLNPAHVLAPPRDWLEALVRGEFSWEFFRLRYKDLLRKRMREHPEPFFALLDASAGDQTLVLTCHCLSGPCHTEVAQDFLEKLRDQAAYQRWALLRHQLTQFPLPVEHPATRRPARAAGAWSQAPAARSA
ncbi:MAG TPA: hypothetical protein VL359_11485 [bacterium]|nr:hypothetical protein [bacterium]